MAQKVMLQEPNHIFILGAAKCGTSSLYHALTASPDICGSQPKEPQFFESNNEFNKGIRSYRERFFPHYRGEPLLLEARGSNLLLPYVPSRIDAFTSRPKFIVVCRDPIKRAFSHWWMRYSRNREHLSFSRAIQKNLEEPDLVGDSDEELAGRWQEAMEPTSGWINMRVYVEMGMYATQIERYCKYFGRDAIHIMITEEVQANPASEMSKLWDFLEIPEGNRGEFATDYPATNEALTSVHARINRLPGRTVASKLLPNPVRNRVRNYLRGRGKKPQLKDEMIPRELHELYQAESEKLANLLRRSSLPWSI